MAKCPDFSVDIRKGHLYDDTTRIVGTSTDVPLLGPTSLMVSANTLNNMVKGTAPTDTRVIFFSVLRAARSNPAVAKTIADAAQINIVAPKFPVYDHHGSGNVVVGTVYDYWIMSLDRNYSHYQTTALDAVYAGAI